MTIPPLELPLTKFEATGNDFLLIDLLDSPSRAIFQTHFASHPRSEWVRRWCDRKRGIGADGLLFLETDNLLDFKWDFFNNDGSSAEMCGNAARGVALYMQKKTGRSDFRFGTRAGDIRAHVTSAASIDIEMPSIKDFKWDLNDQGLNFDFVRSGVPHAILSFDGTTNPAELRTKALKVKALTRFAAEGTNVTFLKKVSDRHIESLTFERGVEDFTLSCGTGAVAAVFALLRGQEGQEVQVDVPGGRLSVVFKSQRPHLKGPAHLTFEARIFKGS